ncbi:MAG: PPK2 family polyphosphate kinase [Pseudomonadota bacterium]
MKDYIEIKFTKKLKLTDIPVKLKLRYHSNREYKALLEDNHSRLAEFQTLLYAGHERAMLIIFQGMDTAGKDGAIKHVMSGVNPQGCSVVSFKTPTSTELDHDFLWRANRVLPVRGQIGIFNRSYYEEVLITKVHPELLEKEKIPDGKKHGEIFWEFRYHDIVNYEKYLHRQGYEIVKIFIHISKDEQKRRLLERFQNPKKLWKISEGDVHERSFWNEYQAAYEESIRNTVSKSSPWYIVPGDDKESARLSISQILVDRFKKMQLEYPKIKSDEKKNLKKLKLLLAKD